MRKSWRASSSKAGTGLVFLFSSSLSPSLALPLYKYASKESGLFASFFLSSRELFSTKYYLTRDPNLYFFPKKLSHKVSWLPLALSLSLTTHDGALQLGSPMASRGKTLLSRVCFSCLSTPSPALWRGGYFSFFLSGYRTDGQGPEERFRGGEKSVFQRKESTLERLWPRQRTYTYRRSLYFLICLTKVKMSQM